MHLVAALRRAEMAEAGAADHQVRRILAVDRGQHPLFLQRPHEVDGLPQAEIGDDFAQRDARLNRPARETEGRAHALDQPALAARGDRERAPAVFIHNLRKAHPFTSLISRRSNLRRFVYRR